MRQQHQVVDRGDVDTSGSPIELTAAQRGMWFAESLSADYSVTVAQYVDVRDGERPLDDELLRRVILEVGRETEMAFTRIVETDGVPMQVVDQSIDNDVEFVDFRDETNPVASAREWMNSDYRVGMDLLSDRLVVSALLRVADDRIFWYVRAHHIALDGYAALTIVYEILNRYNAAVTGVEYVPKPGAKLDELVADDQKYLTSTRRAADREYWAARVHDLPERVTLAQQPAAVPLSPCNAVAAAEIDAARQQTIGRLAASLNSSAAVLLSAGFSAFLARMAGTDDVVLSLPVTGRATARIKRAAGMLSNMLPVRFRDVTRLSMRGLVEQAQLEFTGVLRHQRYRFEDIRIDAGLQDANTASFGPIVNMMFFDKPIELAGATVDYHILSSGILEDLRLNLYQASPGARIGVDLHGNPNLYDEADLSRHLERFLAFLDRVFAQLDTPIGDIDLLLPGERADLLGLGVGPLRPLPMPSAHLLDGFGAAVSETPTAIAVEFGDRRWTYREFDELRWRMAATLRSAGVGEGDRVVVTLDRGPAQVVAIYAVLTLGAAYVPVDPAQPDQRRMLIAETVDARVVIDDEYLIATAFDPDDVASGPDGHGESTRTTAGGGSAAAYVIFTSGSTGVPKGVQVGHEAVLNRLAWMQDNYGLATDDVVLYKTPFTFDVSVWELLWALGQGARLVIAEPGGHRDPAYLRELIISRGISVLHFVPSMLDVYTEVLANEGHTTLLPSAVRYVFTSGEALPRHLAERVIEGSEADLVNLYGPTEAAVDVTEYPVGNDDGPVPIGGPVANTRVHVLDGALAPAPVGVAGELYLAGIQLADGYVGRRGLTSERFVADPSGPAGTRMYRTGDLVRWTQDGTLHYLGRTDFQVKIRGQRVEPGEIEAVLDAMPGVEASAVVPRTDLAAGPVLVAYLRSGSTEVADAAEVTESAALAWCRQHLPSHMVPVAAMRLEQFPLNSSGKLDRKRLPTPEPNRSVEYVAPRTPIELALTSLLTELLGVERIGLRDNIFALGGDSLLAARLVSRARSDRDLRVDLTTVFSAVDVGGIAERTEFGDAPERVELRRVERQGVIPLSHAQTRLWFVNRMDSGAATYNMPGAVRLGHEVDVDALHASIESLVERHETLRTRFGSHLGEPVQEILTTREAMEFLDTEVFDAVDRLDELIAAEAARGFDLVHEIPFRIRILRDRDGYVVVTVLHHIAGDGFSLQPLIRDLMVGYTSLRDGKGPGLDPLEVQYADFAIWQRALLGELESPTPRAAEGLAFWRAELADMPDLLMLPTDRPRPHVATGAGGYVDADLDADIAMSIRGLARDHGVTPFTVVHTALAILLSRWGEVDEVSIGTAVAGRDEPATAQLVGMFVNTVVLRTAVSPTDTVADLLGRAHGTRTRAVRHADIPFEWIVDALSPERSASHTPLFQVALTMHPGHASTLHHFDESARLLDARVPSAKFDLSITVTDQADAGGYHLEFSYATDIFEHRTAERVAAQLELVLRAMVQAPVRTVGTIDIVADEDRGELISGGEGFAAPALLRDLFGAGAQVADPHSLAIAGSSEITWSMLSARSNQLARELVSTGVGPGDIVAICIPRSHQSVISMLAVAASGAAFVSIDPTLPAARIAEMLADSGATVGLSVTDHASRLLDSATWLVIGHEDTEFRLAGHSGAPLRPEELVRTPRLDDLAYLIYTSGSTGRPKAAALSHRGLSNVVANQRSILQLTEESRVLHVASPSFDASIFEIVMALGQGARLVISPAGVFGGDELASLIRDQGVTHAVMTPSALGTIEPAAVPKLRRVISVGEACPPDLMRRWARAGRRFHNLYGPTEASIWATAAGPMTEHDEVSIGGSIPGVGAVVLDRALRPVPTGVPGELYLRGVQLARGYHRRSDLTALRFVADPHAPGERMYRTGDRVIRTVRGDLRYLGRTDFQLKIRGLRIEPGEVEAAIVDHPLVADAVCLGVRAPNGDDVLVAYATLAEGASADPAHVLEHAATRLAGYMVPHTLVVVDEFRLTTSGKIDRKSLPAVDFGTAAPYRQPGSQLEMVVAGVFGQVLGLERVSADADFFHLGGSSLSATKVTARLAALLDREVPVKLLFERPTVSALAAALTSGPTGHGVPALHARSRTELVHVSGMQRGLWLINRAEPESAAYNVAMALRLSGDLDVPALTRATIDLGRRHEALRTVYPMINGEPVQVIMPADALDSEVTLEVRDSDGSRSSEIAQITGAAFDISVRPPVRVVLLRVSADEHVLVFVVHHISADGASMMPLARDLMAAYAARHGGAEPAWKPLQVQYADFSMWLSERLAMVDDGVSEQERQLNYWEQRLSGLPEILELPASKPRPKIPDFDGAAVDFEIPSDVVGKLDEISRKHHTTQFMVTHAVFAVLLARLSGRDDIVIGTPFAGRGEPLVEDVVGMFVNTLALRTRVDGAESFLELLDRVRGDDLADMSHAAIPFDEVVARLMSRPPTAHNPVFQVMLAYQNVEFPVLRLDGLTVEPVPEELTSAKVDLALTLFPGDPEREARGGALRAQFVYATALFDEETVSRMAARYVRLLAELVDDPERAVGDAAMAIDADHAHDRTDHDEQISLFDLIAAAATCDPGASILPDMCGVSFGDLSAHASALSAVVPDGDSALTMALMTLVPGLATASPDELDDVLGSLHIRARAAVARDNSTPADPI
ncbi:amino acid adenylation domain-containing protein [Gordonia sp. DT219]|uniref:amino acid adenylation domain-containing protein n=1 Tax=Gordonia sp. DT219 TaxID=3416658 RepID=UPI003CF0B295